MSAHTTSEPAVRKRRLRKPRCRSCGQFTITVLELGEHRIPDFRADTEPSPRFPLTLMFCEGCGLAQLEKTVPRELLYHDRYGFKSGVNEQIRADLKQIVDSTLAKHPDARSWLDIACNDGTLLSHVPKSLYRAGCDPVWKFRLEAQQHCDRVVSEFFRPGWFTGPGETFDVVTAISMFYDLDDPNEFVDGVTQALNPGGVLVVQQNYLGETLRLNAVDNVCHEHVTYYTLTALEKLLNRHGLEVFDVELSHVNGGCIRTFVARKGERYVTPSVGQLIRHERESGMDTARVFHGWAERVRAQLATLRDFVFDANGRGETVAVYGASTRGGTIWQAAGLTDRDFVFAVDRNPDKHGKTMSSLGLEIVSEEHARRHPPDWMVVSIWFFRDQVIQREHEYLAAGGRLIFPLPEFEVVVG